MKIEGSQPDQIIGEYFISYYIRYIVILSGNVFRKPEHYVQLRVAKRSVVPKYYLCNFYRSKWKTYLQ